ncbi:MAG: putative RNA methyltransferase, partial [Ardenticatenaceae bacterium]
MLVDDCFTLLQCPLCQRELSRSGDALRCSHAHSFDLSREGYINLLLGRGKKLAAQGDTKEMLQARRRFLERGHYRPLSETINTLAARH